ncbi:MAG: hypothetical protein O2806_07785 [Bacteroidetes bacterium]|nr:hypothetical protein [Bacteroidota bacterium]
MNRILMIVMVLSLSTAYGQEKMSFERLKALKMSYITEKIGLTEQEESVFWEIYDSYEKRIFIDCRKKIKNLRKSYMKSIDSITNTEAFQVIQSINKLEHLALKLEEERDKELLEKFPAQKILKMHRAEYHFNREMVYKMKSIKENSSEK